MMRTLRLSCYCMGLCILVLDAVKQPTSAAVSFPHKNHTLHNTGHVEKGSLRLQYLKELRYKILLL